MFSGHSGLALLLNFQNPLCQNYISPLLQACKSPGNLALRMRGEVVWEGILQEVLKELYRIDGFETKGRTALGELFRHSEKPPGFSNVPHAAIYKDILRNWQPVLKPRWRQDVTGFQAWLPATRAAARAFRQLESVETRL